MPSNSGPTYTFFGATGGCANYTLALSLKADKKCVALVRSSQKLIGMLLPLGVPQSVIDGNLHIVEGNSRELEAVKATLSHSTPDVIVSGIGANVMDKKNFDPTVARESVGNILQALRELPTNGKKPHLTLISTTGIDDNHRDVPLLLVPMYHWMLAAPHEDKKAMEKLVVDAMKEKDSPIQAYTFVRPALLHDRNEPKGLSRIEVGTEEKPAIGYAIPRKDVGLWIYERLIIGDIGQWEGQKVSLAAR